MIISTRESKACREKVLQLGVSQISGGSRTSVGGYVEPEEPDDLTSEQFDVEDKRSLDEVVHWLMDLGFIPSFCNCLLQRRQNWRPFYEPLQKRTNSQLLLTKCPYDIKGISYGLCS